jgi:hypothetical protein
MRKQITSTMLIVAALGSCLLLRGQASAQPAAASPTVTPPNIPNPPSLLPGINAACFTTAPSINVTLDANHNPVTATSQSPWWMSTCGRVVANVSVYWINGGFNFNLSGEGIVPFSQSDCANVTQTMLVYKKAAGQSTYTLIGGGDTHGAWSPTTAGAEIPTVCKLVPYGAPGTGTPSYSPTLANPHPYYRFTIANPAPNTIDQYQIIASRYLGIYPTAVSFTGSFTVWK